MAATYQEIQSLYRTEKNSPTLQKVDESFYQDTSKLVSEVGQEYREQIVTLVDEVYRIRRNKILKAVMMNDESPPLNTIAVEKELYNKVFEVLRDHRDTTLRERGNGEVAVEEKGEDVEVDRVEEEKVEDRDMMEVRIVRPLPSFMGSDAKNYGPFDGGESIEIPRNTAIILIKQGIAQEM